MTSPPAAMREEPLPELRFTRTQRVKLWLIALLGRLAIRLIGPTLRYSVSPEAGAPSEEGEVRPAVFAFWHRCVFPACYCFRGRHIAVLTSRSFDGEYIARIIEGFGYRAVRGSSSRGAVAGLRGLHRELDAGRSVAFTIDGPRGPRYVAKPGAALLARNAGVPLVPFYIALDRPWVLRSWDAFMVPRPFSRALVRVGVPIRIPPQSGDGELARSHAELQSALERVRDEAERMVAGNE